MGQPFFGHQPGYAPYAGRAKKRGFCRLLYCRCDFLSSCKSSGGDR
jgi:hypothetical protein